MYLLFIRLLLWLIGTEFLIRCTYCRGNRFKMFLKKHCIEYNHCNVPHSQNSIPNVCQLKLFLKIIYKVKHLKLTFTFFTQYFMQSSGKLLFYSCSIVLGKCIFRIVGLFNASAATSVVHLLTEGLIDKRALCSPNILSTALVRKKS